MEGEHGTVFSPLPSVRFPRHISLFKFLEEA